ncbi:MAG: rod shape-determining protein MreC [Bacillota bacterium]
MKLFRNKLLVAVIVISIMLLASIIVTSHGRTRPTIFEGVLGRVISPVQKVVFSIGQFFDNTFTSLAEIRTLKKENELLRDEVERLRAENRKLLPYRIKNDEYANALSFKNQNQNIQLIGANVSGKDPGNWFGVFTIDKGANAGVEVNDAIVMGHGNLVGKVIEVGANYSKFLALIDQRCSVSIVVNRTRDLGIVSGSGEGEIIAIMPLDADIAVNDDIITSGYSTFPKDLYIGKVKSVEKQERKLQKMVYIEPAVDFQRLEEVFVMKVSVK